MECDAAWKKCAGILPAESSLKDESGRLDLTGEKMLYREVVPARGRALCENAEIHQQLYELLPAYGFGYV